MPLSEATNGRTSFATIKTALPTWRELSKEHSVILTVLMVVSERLQWGLAVFVGKVNIFNGFRYFGSPEGLGTNLWDLLQKTAQNRSSGGF